MQVDSQETTNTRGEDLHLTPALSHFLHDPGQVIKACAVTGDRKTTHH